MKKNQQESVEVEGYFKRLKQLNEYSLIALGLGTCHDYKTEMFIRPDTVRLISVSDGHNIFEEPYKDVWKDDEMYLKFMSCENWIDYFKVLTSEQLDILDTIDGKIRLHPNVKEEILELKSSFGLPSYLDLIISIENYRQEKDRRRPYKPLFHLILAFLTHVERIERIEAKFYDSIYSPI
ncbi:MAG: hypothetical protein K2H46_12415 [Muribaculaceae bacterium]|nr:hypothetical protein [Muribaculaceae bacterium]